MKIILKMIPLLSILLSGLFANGEVTKIYAHYEQAKKSQYKVHGHKHRWGRSKNLVIDGFEYQNTQYKYQTLANKVKIIRHNNKNASGSPCGLFAERTSSGAKYNYKPSFPTGCDMAKVMGGRIINVGALDLFRNSGSTAKNIERVDFIYDNGINAPANDKNLAKAGHVITEKSGNNPIQIAAILSLNANGEPSSYGPLVRVDKIGRNADLSYGITKIYVKNKKHPISKQDIAFLVNEKKGMQGKPWYLGSTREPLGMAFVSLKDLGISAGSKYYGFSYFGEDVTGAYDLTKPETFPVDNFNDTADPYGGVAGYFQDESLPEIDNGTPLTCTSQSFVSFNTSENGPREGDSQFDTISLSDGGLVNHKVLNGVNGVNSIGYNVKDNYIWGYNLKLDKLVRIDAKGNTKLFDLPDGLPSGGYIAADVDKNGILYLAKRGASEIQRVNVDPKSDQFLKALRPLSLRTKNLVHNLFSATTISTADFAFNPKDGKLYYIEEGTSGKVYRIDPDTGTREFVVDSGVDPYVVITFFDRDGNFYFNLGTGSADQNKLYKINMNDPQAATYFTDLDKSLTNGDGARCPNAEVIQPVPTTLKPHDCSKAPTDMVDFNKDFDFDPKKDVSGNGGTGTIARYQNVATVNDQALDLLVKVENLSGFSSLLQTDSTPKGFKFQKAGGDDPSVGFFIDQKRSDEKGTIYDATLKFTYVKHNTNEPVALNFETQVYDLDNFANRTEKVVIDKNDYKFFQLSSDSHIEGTVLGDYHIFMNKIYEDSKFPDKRASVKFVHEGKSTFTMHFQHIKNKNQGQYGGKAGFNIVFGKTENGINTCQQSVSPVANECTLTFPGALSSTNDEIQINDQTKIYGTTNHTLITKSLSAEDTVRCDDAPCQASNTLAKTLSFDLDFGSGKDGDKILSDNQSLTISSNKAYTKFQTGQNNTITINGDLTIKSQSDFYINQGSKITINGNVVIYADKFDANQANQFTINGSLKIIANIFYLNSGNKLYNIPSADKFVVLAKDKVDINSQVDFKGLFYSGGDVQVNNDTHISGALTGNYIDVNDHSIIGYDADAVQAFCGHSQPVAPEPFTCDDTMYFSNASEVGTNSQEEDKMYLHSINRSKSPFSFTKIGDAYDKTYNALGYNPVDNYLYATYNNKLLKIDRDGVVHELGVVDGLAERQNYAGTFDKEGYYYLADWHNSSKIYKIDVNQKKVLDTLTVKDHNNHSLSMEFYDMAIDKSGKYLYMMKIVDLEKGKSQLIKVELATGKASAVGAVVQHGEPATIFCDVTGRIFVLYHKTGFYEVNATTGTQNLVSSVPKLTHLNDGAMCSNATVNLNPILSIGDVKKYEGNSGKTDFAFQVSLSKPAQKGMSFWYTVTDGSDGNETEYHGAYLNDHDMDGISGCIEVTDVIDAMHTNFDLFGSHDNSCQKVPSGVTSIMLHVKVNGDTKIEPDERFFVDIYSPDKATIADGRGNGIILNDDEHVHLNVWDTQESITHQVIKTKVVGEDINLTFASLNNDGTAYKQTKAKDIKIALFAGNTQITMWNEIILETATHMPLQFSTFQWFNTQEQKSYDFKNKAFKDVVAKIQYTDLNNTTQTVSSSDHFAIRPAAYKMVLTDPTVPIKAGKDFNITVEAVDKNGHLVENYDEGISVYDINYTDPKENNPHCIKGSLDIQKKKFTSGQTTLLANYNEAGDIRITFSEHKGGTVAFADIDKSDTDDNKRYIKDASAQTGKINPASFDIKWDFTNGGTKYTYFSHNPKEMGANLDVNISAINLQKGILHNFNKDCYGEDVTITADYQRDANISYTPTPIAIYENNATIFPLHDLPTNSSGNFTYKIEKELFTAGKGAKHVRLNFDRDTTTPHNPMLFSIKGIDASLGTTTVSKNQLKTLKFVYARAYAPDQQVEGKEIVAKIFYEVYCKECNKPKFGFEDYPEGVDSINWLTLPSVDSKLDYDLTPDISGPASPSYAPGSITANYKDGLKFMNKTNRALTIDSQKTPLITKVKYVPKSYLMFNPFNAAPAQQSFSISFSKAPKKWAGKGNQGGTVDLGISSTAGYRKIDW